MAVHYDGTFTARTQHGDVRVEPCLLEASRLYIVTYRQLRANFVSDTPDYTERGPGGTAWSGCALVDFTQPTDLGGGLCEFTITWATTPATRTGEPELYTYEYQMVSGGEIYTLSMPVPSTVVYTYTLTNTPSSISLATVFRAVKVGSAILYVGTIPGAGAFLAEDESAPRWKGNIFCKKTRTVPERIPA